MTLLVLNPNREVENPRTSAVVATANLFNDNNFPFNLIVLQECFDFMSKQKKLGLHGINYWNAFDDIQMVSFKSGLPVTMYDLPFQTDVEPLYKGSKIYFYKNNQKIYQVNLRNNTEIASITYYLADGSFRQEFYDDRGFISTIIYANADYQIVKKQWLTPLGQVVMASKPSGEIEVAADFRKHFKKATYSSIEEIVAEKYYQKFGMEQTIITSTNQQNELETKFPLLLIAKRKLVLINDNDNQDFVGNLMNEFSHDWWIFPSQYMKDKLKNQAISHQLVLDPYPTSFDLGISNELETKIIYLFLRNQNNETVNTLVEQVLPLLLEDENKILLFETDDDTKKMINLSVILWIQGKLNINVNSQQYNQFSEVVGKKEFETESQLLDFIDEHLEDEPLELNDEEKSDYYRVMQLLKQISFVDESNVLHDDFKATRLYVDLTPNVNLENSALAVSVGIPQVTLATADLVENGSNGLLLNRITDLDHAIRYFTDNLNNWNKSLVKDVALIEQFSSEMTLNKWKGVIGNGKN